MRFFNVIEIGYPAIVEENGKVYRFVPDKGVSRWCRECGSCLAEKVPFHAIPDEGWNHEKFCTCGRCLPPVVDMQEWRKRHPKESDGR